MQGADSAFADPGSGGLVTAVRNQLGGGKRSFLASPKVAGPFDATCALMPPTLHVVRPGKSFARQALTVDRGPSPPLRRLAAGLVLLAGGLLIWVTATADTRALRGLPDDQRQALFERTVENLRGTCDPAPPRSLREFCREQATLAARFRECEAAPECQVLVRRHLFQPRR